MLLQTTLGVRNKHTMNKSKPLNSEINLINIYGRFDQKFFIAQRGLLMLCRE
jgi:hypothetical protein